MTKKITNQTPVEEINKTIEDIDKDKPDENADVDVKEDEENPSSPPEDVKTDETPPSEPPPSEPPPSKEDTEDYKAKYAGSTREAQVLAAKNKQLTETIAKAAVIPDPDDAEMRKEYGDNWDVMDEVQKKMAREALVSSRRFQMIHQVVEGYKKTDEWIDKVRNFTTDTKTITKYPQLEGRETEFVQFCSIPSRVGVDIEDLVRAFSFGIKPIKPKRENLFETGGGGGEATKPKELTIEEIASLRVNNNKEYTRLVKAGKIKIDL
jgi:hypothetical protein